MDRRQLLSTLAALGIGTPVFHRAVVALAQDSELSAENLKQAASGLRKRAEHYSIPWSVLIQTLTLPSTFFESVCILHDAPSSEPFGMIENSTMLFDTHTVPFLP